MLDLAVTLERGVDFHLDEHGSGIDMLSEYVADGVIKRGLQSRVTISHACALAALVPEHLQHIGEKIAQAGIDVVALPATNLYLPDNGPGTAASRGAGAFRQR